jgi:hypothetical protein
VQFSAVSYPKWPSALPPLKRIRLGLRTNRLERRAQGWYSSVRSVDLSVDISQILISRIAGLSAGVTEAVAVVTPMEVVKIRLQAQQHSLMDPLETPRYRNAAHAVYTIVREEGFVALYRGVSLTALRQATNQGPIQRRVIRVTEVLSRRKFHGVPRDQEGRASTAT